MSENSLEKDLILMDEQHKGISDIINQLILSARTDSLESSAEDLLEDLFNLWREHFALEERCMLVTEFPELERQRKEHRNFSEIIDDCRKGLQSKKIVISTELILFLLDWFNSHIINEDIKYAQFLHKRSIKSTCNYNTGTS